MASKLFLVDLDLNLNKAKNFRLEDFSTDPSTSLESGRLVYFTGIGVNQNHFKAYNGTAWKTLAYTDDVPDIEISLEAATGFTVSGSPADASGTLTFEWDEVAPGYVLAGALDANTSPAPGNSIPTFRALGEQDIPVEIARVDDVNTSLDEYILLTEKGEPLGVAELNASGTVPAEQLDLGSYVTLTGAELLSNKSYEGVLTFEDEDGEALTDAEISLSSVMSGGSLDTSVFKIAHTGDFSRLEINSKNVAISATNEASLFGATSYVQGTSDVILSGFSGGEYLGSVDPDNQIAKIGDLFEISATVTGTANQIDVSDTGTNDYVLSLPAEIILGGTSKSKIRLKNASDVQTALFQSESTGDFSLIGDANLIVSATGGEYLGSVSAPNQIATIGDIEALDAYDITATQISNWDTAYSWGNHALSGYLTTAILSVSNSDSNLVVFSGDSENVTIDLASTIGVSTINTASATGSLFDNGPSLITFGIITPEIEIGSDEGTVTINNDLIVTGDLTVNGDVTTLNTATMNVEDNIFVLNSNVTGTPSVDAGIEVERGDADNASLIWNEGTDKWSAGTVGSELAIARKYSVKTTGTTHTITHNLATTDVTVNCWLNDEQVEAAIVVTDANTVTVTTNSSTTNLKTVVVG
jgi:hypothetical protein